MRTRPGGTSSHGSSPVGGRGSSPGRSTHDVSAGRTLPSDATPLSTLGSGVVIRQTCAGERVLDGQGTGLVSLFGVTVTGGNLTSDEPTESANGGAIRTRADLVLEKAVVTGNSATGAVGISAEAGGAPTHAGSALGGGVFVGGALVATESTISANRARADR